MRGKRSQKDTDQEKALENGGPGKMKRDSAGMREHEGEK